MIYHLIDTKSAHQTPNVINNIIRYAELCETSEGDHVFILLDFDEDKHKEILRKIPDIPTERLRLVGRGWRKLRKEILPLNKLKCVIVIHGINSRSFWLTLATLPISLISKAVWVCWGAGVQRCTTLRPAYFIDLVKKRVMRHFKCVVTLLEKDKNLIEKNFVAKKIVVASYMSQSIDIDSPLYDFDKNRINNGGDIKVLLGNSAWPENNHIEALKTIQSLNGKGMQVFCPLSYGPKEPWYMESVIIEGRKLFGDDFMPMLDLLPTHEYVRVIHDMDVVINYSDRQMALFALYVAVNLGKKVVLKLDSANYKWFQSMGIHVYSLEEMKDFESFKEPMSLDVIERNRANLRKFVNKKSLAGLWADIYRY